MMKRYMSLLAVFLLLAAMLPTYASVAKAAGDSEWASREVSSGTTRNLKSVAYGNGGFVAVGENGTVLTSSDGAVWVSHNQDENTSFSSVTYGNGQFVAVGDSSDIYTSIDGAIWTAHEVDEGGPFYSVAYGNGLYIATRFPDLWISTDGTNWSRREALSNGQGGAAFGNGKIVTVGSAGDIIVSEDDGDTWDFRTTPSGDNLTRVAYGNGTFVVGGFRGLYTSVDGMSWTQRDAARRLPKFNDIIYEDGVFAAISVDHELMTSSDGSSWVRRGGNGAFLLADLAYGEDMYIAVGGDGKIIQFVISGTVNFDTQGGSKIASMMQVKRGAGIQAPSPPSRKGYQFAGWYKEATYGTLWNFDTDKVADDMTLYAKWSQTYAVAYDSQGGSPVKGADDLLSGAELTAPEAPERCGYVFAGWYKDNGYGVAWDFASDTVQGNMTLYAKWSASPSACSIAFDSRGGSEVEPLNGITPGTTIAEPEVPTKYGFLFEGWYQEPDLKTPWAFDTDTVTYNRTLYARWTADVFFWDAVDRSFDTSHRLVSVTFGGGQFVAGSDSGLVLTSSDGKTWSSHNLEAPYALGSLAYGEGIYAAVDPSNGVILTSRDGVAWTVSASYSLRAIAYSGGMFIAVGDDGRIVTSGDGESWVSRNSESEADLNDVAYGGDRFVAVGDGGTILISGNGVHWSAYASGITDSLTGIAYGNGKFIALGNEFDVYVMTDSLELTKQRSNKHTNLGISFGDGVFVVSGWFGMQSSRDGIRWYNVYSHDAYYDAVFGKDTYVGVGVFGAIMQLRANADFIVTFDSQGGSLVADRGGLGISDYLPEPAPPEKSGFTFAGWYREAELIWEWYFAGDTVQSDMTLYAKWVPDEPVDPVDPETYTVSFDSQGGSAVAAITDVNPNTMISEPSEPQKSGYTFAGWYVEAELVTAWNFATFRVPRDLTLYAKWVADEPVTYTVSFDSQGGSAVPAITGILPSTKITEPTAPEKSGYTFAGWYAEAELETAWNFATYMVLEDLTLYAKWVADEPVTYTVSFDSGGGSAVTAITGILPSTKITEPTAPEKSGYTFAGWYAEAELETAWNFATYMVQRDLTLYAKWVADEPVDPVDPVDPEEPVTYTVTFDSQGGSAVAAITDVDNGAKILEPLPPAKSQYTFAGWYKDAELTVRWQFLLDEVNVDVTLYAKWEPIAVDDDDDGGGSDEEENSESGGGNGEPGGSEGGTPPAGGETEADEGELLLPAGAAGDVSLGNKIHVHIPAGATDQALRLTIQEVLETASLLEHDEVLLSRVHEVLSNIKGNFDPPVELVLTFNPSQLSANQRPSVFYYNETERYWVEIGGSVSGNEITVKVDHFTKFAVLAVDQPVTVKLSDIAGHWAETNIARAVQQGIASGYPDGSFQPNLAVTRAQLAVLLTNALKLEEGEDTLSFTDQAQIPSWARSSVAAAVKAGILKGYDDGIFRPDAEVTRAELAVMVARALKLAAEPQNATGFDDDSAIPVWAKGAAMALQKLGIMEGVGGNAFHPAGSASRAEVITVLLRMLEQAEN